MKLFAIGPNFYPFGLLCNMHSNLLFSHQAHVVTMPLATKNCDAGDIAKCKSHLLVGLQVTNCLLFPNDIGGTYMSQQVHTSLHFIQETHYRLVVDWTHSCCNVMMHLVHMLCDLICFRGDGRVAMGVTVVGAKLNSESKIVRILEKTHICRTVKIILPYGKKKCCRTATKKQYGKNVFAVQQNRFCRAVRPANTANFLYHITKRGVVSRAICTC